MAEKMYDSEFWLPAEFLDEDFFLEDNRVEVAKGHKGSYARYSMESESEEDDYIEGLTRQMAQSFLGEEKVSSISNDDAISTSPQSTLCDAGIWSASSDGSPNGPSQVSSPPTTPLDQRKDDAWDLLYAAAGQVGKIRQNEQSINGRGSYVPSKKPSYHLGTPGIFYETCSPVLTQQQLRSAQFFQLKQQQLIKHQVSSAWSRHSRARNNRSLGLGSPWSHAQRQHEGSGMMAVFLNSSGTRRESSGTGVFLPRRTGNLNEHHKKTACSTVLLPARVVHALNLNFNNVLQQRYPGCSSFGHDIASNIRGNSSIPRKSINRHPPPAIISGREIRLPQDWTY